MTTLTVMIPTIGRSSLIQALRSLQLQKWIAGDQVMVIGDGPQPSAEAAFFASGLPGQYVEIPNGPQGNWGHPIRNAYQQRCTTDFILHLDDDDALLPEAVETIRTVVAQNPGRPHLFRVLYESGAYMWSTPELKAGNVSTQLFVYPNDRQRMGKWEYHFEGDYAFIDQTCAFYPDDPIWREEAISFKWAPQTLYPDPCPVPGLPAYYPIDGWSGSQVDYQQAVADVEEGAVLVEIGSWLGSGTSAMIRQLMASPKSLLFYTVDTWQGVPQYPDTIEYAQSRGGSVFPQFLKHIVDQGMQHHVRPLLMTPIQASECFPDRSVDFVFINNRYQPQDLRMVLLAWQPKLKPGGILAGELADSHRADLTVIQTQFHNHPALQVEGLFWRIQLPRSGEPVMGPYPLPYLLLYPQTPVKISP